MAEVSKQEAHVIVSVAHGCVDVFPATRETAMKLFDESRPYLMPETIELANMDRTKIRPVSVGRAAVVIRETFLKAPGDMAVALRNFLYGYPDKGDVLDEARPRPLVTEQWQVEIALWLARSGLLLEKLGGADVFDHGGLELSMFAPLRADGRELRVVRWDDYFEMAEGYARITQQAWPEHMPEHLIATHIVNYVKRYINAERRTVLQVVKVTDC
ncbi:hypothetical protein [Burkholderia cenocepacia]|uniref:hypothetical protein n=1 Tax=Burkholderia cenocepacia TaxID=95486 RepID=UPI00076161B4|nr:hypothetical protein [Burkholderia cenocepacia]KWU19157.1 hypothetical protein AS149_12990 [Burkholderia cenocepacia]